MAEEEQLQRVYIILEKGDPSFYLEKDFLMYFDIDGGSVTFNKNKHECATVESCQCHRLCSFVTKNMFYQANGLYGPGQYNWHLVGVYRFKGEWNIY